VITLTPISGYTAHTPFTFNYSGLSGNYSVNWGDGIIEDLSTRSHYYSAPNIYNVYVTNCSAVSCFTLSAFSNHLYADNITLSYPSISAYTSCPLTLNIHLSATNPSTTVLLYASGSGSNPASTDTTFWQHLNPTWGFYDNSDTLISEITLNGTPVYSGTSLLGYSALSSVSYIDDMPGKPVLFFTVKKTQQSALINSRSYVSIEPSISAIVPSDIQITCDGLNDLPVLQWANHDVPFVTSVISNLVSCSNMLHYASGYLTDVTYIGNCYGVNPTEYSTYVSDVNPYAFHSFFLPSSALPVNEITPAVTKCGENPYEQELTYNRYTPTQVSISATGIFNVNGLIYSLTGISNPFNIYPFENFHSFYRKGEDNNVYNLIKQYSHIDIEQHPMFNSYLSAIGGEGMSLGRVYDKIQNFASDHADIDLCQISSIHDIAQSMDVEMDEFSLQYPEELKRLMDFFSVPLQKLIGTRCKCNNNFVSCQNVCNKNTCTLCGFDKRSNLGDQLSLTDNLTAGDNILYREKGSEVYNILSVKAQDANIYPLLTLTAQPIYSKGLANFCFFKWDKTPQNHPIEGLVNYKDVRNNLSPSLSSYSDWYSDGGIIEETLNYILTKNLIDI